MTRRFELYVSATIARAGRILKLQGGTSTSPLQLRALSCMVWPRKFKLVQRRRETRGPRRIKHRGALLCLASAEDLAPTLARMSGLQQLIFKTLCALTCARPESRHDFRFVGDAGQRAAWQRSTLDPHRDLAVWQGHSLLPGGVIDLLTKIDPADTISASPARYLNHMIRSKFPPLAGAALPDASAGAALPNIGREPDRCQVRTRGR